MKQYNEEALKHSPEANNHRPWQQCSISVMDTIFDPDITFDEQGRSNYYHVFEHFDKQYNLPPEQRKQNLQHLVNEIKSRARSAKYDCVLGISGGVDSSYLALLCKQNGLNPLLVHFDYGWNSEIAVSNIENISKYTGFDLYTYVINWEQFKELQRSYFKASVLDLDIPADHLIFGALHDVTRKFKIRSILSGGNYVTECILPASWNYNKFDLVNLKAIHYSQSKMKLNKLPLLGFYANLKYTVLNGIKQYSLLNHVPYDKFKVIDEIKSELHWKDYGGKHFESVFTRFYQGYILPVKFGIDKRKAHLSNLVFAGSITKEKALEILAQPVYPVQLQQEDYEYVAKKLSFEPEEWDRILTQPNKKHSEFPTDARLWKRYYKLLQSTSSFRKIFSKKK